MGIFFSKFAFAYPVVEGNYLDFAASFFSTCSGPYCSSLSPDHYNKLCGSTSYKYYCGEGNTCQDGKCVLKQPSSSPSAPSCIEGWVGDYYCSSLSNAKTRLWQNKDCSTTSFKYSCLDSQKCESGSCVSKTIVYEVKLLDSYCSDFSNARIELWQNLDGSTTNKKYFCATDEKCDNAVCIKYNQCDYKLLKGPYCSELGENSYLNLYQNTDCSTTSIKKYCGSNEKCVNGNCENNPSCDSKKLKEYCSELSNSRIELWQNSDCSSTSKKYSCGTDEQCEQVGSYVKCLKKGNPVGIFGFFGFIGKYFFLIVIGIVVLAFWKPQIFKMLFAQKWLWIALLALAVISLFTTAASNVLGTVKSWFGWLLW